MPRDPEAHKLYMREYRKSEKYKAVARRSSRAWQVANREKARAHDFVRAAINRGSMVRPNNCGECGNDGRIQGHHEDYSKPLEVIWLCEPCHKELHKLKKETAK